MHRFLIVTAAVCFCAATANAQTKISGTSQCAKPDPMHVLPVGDRPDHSMSVAQLKCTWSKPMEIGTDKTKEGTNTETSDISGNTSRARGVHVETMESGDKFYVWYSGTATSKGAPPTAKGTWAFTGGTGKLKGIKGKGTYTCAPSTGDMLECKIDGEYELAAK